MYRHPFQHPPPVPPRPSDVVCETSLAVRELLLKLLEVAAVAVTQTSHLLERMLVEIEKLSIVWFFRAHERGGSEGMLRAFSGVLCDERLP